MRVLALSGETIADIDETFLRQIASGVGLGTAVKKFLQTLLGVSAYRLKLLLADQEVPDELTLLDLGTEVDLQLVVLPYCQELARELVDAAESGHLFQAKRFLELSQDPNAKCGEGLSPLHSASRMGHLDMVRLLVEARADTNQAGIYGTPLLVAAERGRLDVVRYLIEAGAGKDEAKDDGSTALFCAASGNHLEVVKFLLEAGVDKDLQRADGATPLLSAAASDHLEVVQCLVHAGADMNLQRNNGFASLHFAVFENNVDVARFLVHAGADTNKGGKDGDTPLLFASMEGHMELARLLLEASADINKSSDNGSTPLLCAAEEGHSELVRVLVEAGADKEEARCDGSTPLLCAAAEGHVDVVRILLDAKADINKCRMDGSTALTCAIAEEFENVVEALQAADPKWSRQGKPGMARSFSEGCSRSGHNQKRGPIRKESRSTGGKSRASTPTSSKCRKKRAIRDKVNGPLARQRKSPVRSKVQVLAYSIRVQSNIASTANQSKYRFELPPSSRKRPMPSEKAFRFLSM